MPRADNVTKQVLRIDGMTCANCEVAVERVVSRFPAVQSVRVNHARSRAEIVSSEPLDIEGLGKALAEDGYTVTGWDAPSTQSAITRRDYLEVGAAFAVLAGLYLALRALA